MGILKQIVEYFGVYRKYLGNRLYFIFLLSLLATMTESVGIMMLLPLIEAMDSDIGEKIIGDSEVKDALQSFLDFTNIGDSAMGILLFIAAVFLLKGFIQFASNAYQAQLTANLMKEMKGGMFNRYMSMDYLYYSSRNTGHFINIINEQITGLISTFKNYKVE